MQNFDEVLVPADHVSRSPNDTYYINKETVLRCHTSAHQAETLRKGERAFLVTGLLPFETAYIMTQSLH
jgi:phenylalanyl-tRNA synthetase alpha chain